MCSKKLSALFLCVADEKIGYGHFNRCIKLASEIRKNFKIKFIIFTTEETNFHSKQVNFEFDVVSIDHLNSEKDFYENIAEDLIVLDLFFFGFSSIIDYKNIFSKLNLKSRLLIAIDTLGDQSICSQKYKNDKLVILAPYIHEASRRVDPKRFRHVLEGEKYALLDKSFKKKIRRKFKYYRKNILVTSGGSDPYGYTVDIIKGIGLQKLNCVVRIIVGPMFSSSYVRKIQIHAKNSKTPIQIKFSPSSLVKDFNWCDFCLSASGLTKYELAAFGTPTILFSIDSNHHNVNRAFISRVGSIDIGHNIRNFYLLKQIKILLKNNYLLMKMSKQSSSVIDNMGVTRIADFIQQELLLKKYD